MKKLTMNFKPYKQQTLEGCLPVCLLLLTKGEATENEELELAIEGIKTKISYALKVLNTFSVKYGKGFRVYIDNKFFLKELEDNFDNKDIQLVTQTIDSSLMNSISTPYILYIDAQEGFYPHAPHFIIVESVNSDNTYKIFDPWLGESRVVENLVLQKSVEQLRNYLLFCPLIITFK
jgi:hypothetical protein